MGFQTPHTFAQQHTGTMDRHARAKFRMRMGVDRTRLLEVDEASITGWVASLSGHQLLRQQQGGGAKPAAVKGFPVKNYEQQSREIELVAI